MKLGRISRACLRIGVFEAGAVAAEKLIFQSELGNSIGKLIRQDTPLFASLR